MKKTCTCKKFVEGMLLWEEDWPTKISADEIIDAPFFTTSENYIAGKLPADQIEIIHENGDVFLLTDYSENGCQKYAHFREAIPR